MLCSAGASLWPDRSPRPASGRLLKRRHYLDVVKEGSRRGTRGSPTFLGGLDVAAQVHEGFDGLAKVAAGLTSLEELARVTV